MIFFPLFGSNGAARFIRDDPLLFARQGFGHVDVRVPWKHRGCGSVGRVMPGAFQKRTFLSREYTKGKNGEGATVYTNRFQ